MQVICSTLLPDLSNIFYSLWEFGTVLNCVLRGTSDLDLQFYK